MRPAPTRSTTETATWATTSAERAREVRPTAGGGASIAERADEIDFGRKGRQQGECQAGEQRDDKGEEKDRAVQRDLARPRRESGGKGGQQPHRARSEPEPQNASGQGQQAAFAKSWRMRRPRSAPSAARSASSRSRRMSRASVRLATLAQAMSRTNPAVPSSRSSVGRARRPISSCSEATRTEKPWPDGYACGYWERSLAAIASNSVLAACDRLTGSESAEQGEHPSGAALPGGRVHAEGAGRRRHVDVVLAGVLRHRREDADHGVDPVVHLEGAADDRRVPAELVHPVAVAQHEHRIGSRLILALAEGAPEVRSHAEHVEEVGGNHAGLDPARLAVAQQDEGHRVILDDALRDRLCDR